MRLSGLQKYILNQCYLNKNKTRLKIDFYVFYSKSKRKKIKKVQDIIHRSLENLVAKYLIIAYGRKTAQKWFINKVKLTSKGKRVAKETIKKRQRKLPIK